MPRYRFGDFVVDSDSIEVVGPDGVRDVEPQVFDVLTYLLEQRGRMVTKEELLDNVWGDRFVSESALTTRIKQARRAIDDDGTRQWAIKTVHGRGYRFLPEISVAEAVGVDRPERAAAEPAELPYGLRPDARQLFCGRVAELQQCLEVIGNASHDQPYGWVWILGEPGIGKTRLAAEVASEVRRRGHRVVFGRNGEDLKVPYQPFIEVLRQLAAGDHDDDPASPIPPDLAPLLPLAEGTEPRAGARDSNLDNETRRYRMFEAFADWLAAESVTAPVTMVIDDIHWAADSTLQLLSHLQQRQLGAAVTFVLTARDTAPDDSPRVADLLAAGQGQPNSAIVRLGGLEPGDAVRLVGEGADLDEVMRQTAGNPLFLQAVSPLDGSVDMQSAVRRRLARLDARVQETLRLASVLGLEFEVRVAAAAAGVTELDLLEDLERAVAARLLDDVGLDRFRFTHALVRSSLRGELSSARRGRLHERIAGAVADLFAGDLAHLPELAYHTSEAAFTNPTLRPVAIERLRHAARESMAQYSFEEAADSLRLARRHLEADDSFSAARLALEQGIAETRSGQNMLATHTFEEAISAARRTDDPALVVEAALRYEDASWRPGRSGEAALAYVGEAIDVLDSNPGSSSFENEVELRVRLTSAKLRSMAMSGRRDGLDDAFTTALRLARDLGSPDLEANVLNVYLGQVRLYQGVQGTDPLVGRLAELEPAIVDGDIALHAIHVRMLHATMCGRFDRMRGLARTMADLQERAHSNFWRFIRTNQEAMEAFYRGDLDTSEELAERCLELADALPEEDGAGTYGLRMFMIRREQDRLAVLAPMVRHVLSRPTADAIWTPGLALLLVETGSAEEAAEVLRPVRSTGFDLPVDAMWSTVMVLLIESMVALDDAEACSILTDRFSPMAGANVTMASGLLCFGRAERYLGMLALTQGDADAAEQFLGVALEADEAGGSTLWCNESRLWLSRARRAQGHVEEANAMLSVVAQQASGSGLRRLERIASAELRP